MASSTDLDGFLASTFRFRWNSGAETPIGPHTTGWRRMPDAMLAQVVRTRTVVEITGRPTRIAEPGMAIVIDGGVHHRLTSTVNGRGVSRWGHCAFLVLDSVSVLSLFDLPPVVSTAIGKVVGDTCAELADRHAPGRAPLPLAGLREAALAGRLLDTLIGGAPLTASGLRLVAHADRLTPVLAWIERHLAEPVSRAGLARIAGLSPSRFHDLFLAVLGKPPMAYLAQRRMGRAQQLLMSGTEPVQVVAGAVGFPDPFHFSRVFRRLVGQSPSTYRSETARLLPGGGPVSGPADGR